MNKKIKLYKLIDGKLRLVDFGIPSMINLYTKRGFFVDVVDLSDNEPIWKPPVVRRPIVRKPSFMNRVKGFFKSLIPMEVCYA